MYKNIGDYGLIGDMNSIALVSQDGSVDYCSMPHIDSPTVFAALLDDEKGGFYRIQPRGRFEAEQKYLENTNILSCMFRTDTGQAELINFMTVTTREMFEEKSHAIHRCIKVHSGSIDFVLECFPRSNYATELPSIERKDNIFKITTKNETYTLLVKMENYQEVRNDDNGITIYFSLHEQQVAHFDFVYGEKQPEETGVCGFEETHTFWIDWLYNCVAGKCKNLEEYSDMINRSLLTLKLLTFQPTGAIVAAPTTSLPECIGGERNWDYRFSWIRDASFTLRALFSVGHIDESDGFIRWLHNTYQRYGSRNLQILYSIEGEDKLTEKMLKHLKGYKNSKPVRIGNAAYEQDQWDIYGEIMDTALRLSDYVGRIDESLWPFFKNICHLAIQNWHKPDYGIWEMRNGPFHFVYSKVMCWVAVDRGIKIAKRYGFDAPLDTWEKEKERIREDILEKGYDRDSASFVQYYGSKNLDASLMLLPLMNFLPIHDERVQNTIGACKKILMKDGFLLRYSGDDGLYGEEGAFILCNFWLVECLTLSGKIPEAKELLGITIKAANYVGLFSEEYDPKNQHLLGNFPQAFGHIGFINSAWSILNAQYKISEDTIYTSWKKRLGKLIPFTIVLNKTDTSFPDTSESIAKELKVTLNNLQGAFFDVMESKVNYEAMRRSEGYKKYTELVKKLNTFDPFKLKTDEEKKAFWINIYNILIIHGVIELDIEKSVKEVFRFFGRIGYAIGGFYFTPNDIEHGILRANRPEPTFKIKQFSWFDKRKALRVAKLDPRIHFALVCAASSCPPIEFYDPAQIDNQLDIAGRSFINRKGMVLDKDANTLQLSQIFKWFASDFGRTQQQVISYILNFTGEKVKEYILENIDTLKITYLPYNWNLNRSLE
ncbi:MAG: DUF547 domain-containing protein [wastewater metagenome]|nr:DUF547 domain-containing protein [Candidatus Loosdrechtia aerotolerans]